MQVESIAECILQYFRPLLSYHLSLGSLFCLFLSDRFTKILMYKIRNLFKFALVSYIVHFTCDFDNNKELS